MPHTQAITEEYLESGRSVRIIAYASIFLAGVAAFMAPSIVLEEQGSVWVARICAFVWTAGALPCLYGTIRRSWSQEYVLIPVITAALWAFSVALAVESVQQISDNLSMTGESSPPVAASYAFLLTGFGALLLYRHARVRVFMKLGLLSPEGGDS